MRWFWHRLLGVILSLAILAVCVPVSVSAAYENTHINTGDQAADIIAIAETQVGYLEGSLAGTTAGSNNYTKYGKWYADYFNSSSFAYGAWCAMFVSWCAAEADVPPDVFTYHASCTAGVSWWKQRNLFEYSQYYDGDYVPKAGDVIYFGDSRTSMSHVGLVRYAEGGRVYTIEGNTSGQHGEINEGGGCFRKDYSLGYSRIVGYATPKYELGKGSRAEKLGTYRITASSLNVRKGTDTTYDIVGVLDNGELTVVTELSNGWGKVTLPDGVSGWCAIGDYGDYIGVDALNTAITPYENDTHLSFVTDENGSVTFTNSGTQETAIRMPLPFALGNRTTPYWNIAVHCHSGRYGFGITDSNSAYSMMRDPLSGDELVVTSSRCYMGTDERLQIDIGYWWSPEDNEQVDTVELYLEPNSSITVLYCYFAEQPDVVTSVAYNQRKGHDGDRPVMGTIGDVNGDEAVTTADGRAILKHLLGEDILGQAALQLADFDGNGSVTSSDVRALLSTLF